MCQTLPPGALYCSRQRMASGIQSHSDQPPWMKCNRTTRSTTKRCTRIIEALKDQHLTKKDAPFIWSMDCQQCHCHLNTVFWTQDDLLGVILCIQDLVVAGICKGGSAWVLDFPGWCSRQKSQQAKCRAQCACCLLRSCTVLVHQYWRFQWLVMILKG